MPTKLKSVQPLIPTLNVDKAINYYQDTLGFKLAWSDGSPASFAIVYRNEVELFLTENQNPEFAKNSSIRISVDGIDDLFAEYSENGHVKNSELSTKPWGLKEFTVFDLNGVAITFHELPSEEKKVKTLPNQKLETKRLNLLPLDRSHYSSLHDIYSSKEAMIHWHTFAHESFLETEKLLDEYLATHSSWVLENTESKKIIGLVNCFSIIDSKPTGMGYILHPDFQKKGLAFEATLEIIAHVFKHWNLPYLELWIYDDNIASIKLAKQLGFQLENSFERSAPGEKALKKTGIYWLRQSHWWKNSALDPSK